MKISCLPVSLFGDMIKDKISIKDWAFCAKESGLDAIDLSTVLIKNHTPIYLKSLKHDLEICQIPVVMLVTYPDFTHPDHIQREREIEYLSRDIALASYLGAKYVRILAGQAYPKTPTDAGIHWVIESFKKIADTASKFKIMLLYENHSKPGVWDHNDFSHPTDIFLQIVEGIRDTGIRINFDTANTLVYGTDPLPVLKTIINYVETIHAADTAQKGFLKPVPIGQGIVPFKDIFKYLKEKGFDGWICIEEASRTGMDAFGKAADFIRGRWSEI